MGILEDYRNLVAKSLWNLGFSYMGRYFVGNKLYAFEKRPIKSDDNTAYSTDGTFIDLDNLPCLNNSMGVCLFDDIKWDDKKVKQINEYFIIVDRKFEE